MSLTPFLNQAICSETADGMPVPLSLVEKAALFYGQERWPECRIISITPYFALDGSINAFAVQFAKKDSNLSSEKDLEDMLPALEDQEKMIYDMKPQYNNKIKGSTPSITQGTDNIEFHLMGAQVNGGMGARAHLPPNIRNRMINQNKEYNEYLRSLHQWEIELRSARNASVLADEIGTVIIAARYDLYPLLERFDGVAPHIKDESKVKDITKLKKIASKSIRKSFYLGPLSMFHESILKNGENQDSQISNIIDARGNHILDLKKTELFKRSGRLKPAEKNKLPVKPQGFWDSLNQVGFTPTSTTGEISTLALNSLLDVPYYHQDDFGVNSCGPTASAQVLGYWDDHGYGNLVDNGSSTTGHVNELVYDLMHAEGYDYTCCTDPETIESGIEALCNSDAYGNNLNFDVVWIHYAVSWEADIVAEINAGRPFVYLNWNEDLPPGWFHYTTGTGYNDNSGHILYVHTNFPPDTPYELNWDNIPSNNQDLYKVSPNNTPEFDCTWSEDFEGSFPGRWLTGSDGANPGYWAKTSYTSHNITTHPTPPEGDTSWSGYCVGSHVNPPGPYPNNINGWMIYGPFSTEGKDSGEVITYIWRNIIDGGLNDDSVGIFASIDGSNFWGWTGWGDYRTWNRCTLDLTNVYNLGNIMNQPEVWIALWFHSDQSVTSEGAYVDDISIKLSSSNINHNPEITAGSVSPAFGDASTQFTYSVHYYDQDGDNPSMRNVYINGSPYSLNLASGTPSNGTYQYQTSLPLGTYNYYFYFADGKGGSATLPFSGTYTGPKILHLLNNDIPVTYSEIPNDFSFHVENNRWCGIAINPSTDHDIMIDDDPDFSSPYQRSESSDTTRDFIVSNGHIWGEANHYAQVYYGSPSQYIIEEEWEAHDLQLGIPASGAVNSNQVIEVYEVDLTSGQQYKISVDTVSGNANLSLYMFVPSRASGSRSSNNGHSDSSGPGGDENLTFTANGSGYYGIVLINNNGGSSDYTVSVSKTLISDFYCTPTRGFSPLNVSFTDQSTGGPTNWSWIFGDGGTSTLQNPTHLYTNPGMYSVSLTATGAGGTDTETKTDYIIAETDTTPTASIASPSGNVTIIAGQSVNFQGSVTGGNAPLTYQWTFPGGAPGSSTVEDPGNVAFASAGTYSVTFKATDTDGDVSNTASVTVTVNALCDVNFTATPTNGFAPLSVSFTDTSSGLINSWEWTFGDGDSSTEQNPTHTYSSAGIYTVSLTVTGACGTNSISKAGYITSTQQPDTYYVAPSPAGNDNSDGSVTHPFATIQHALDVAQGSQTWPITIRVAAGVYYENITMDSTDTYVSVLGGWNNSFTERWEAESIIDGGGNRGPCMILDQIGQGIIINGFTITNGYSDGSSLGTEAAGIVNHNSSPTITNCLFTGNVGWNGGAMYNFSSSPTLTNCIFNGNMSQYGAGMYNVNSTPTLINCTFTHNTAVMSGGGIYNENSSLVVRNCILSNDAAPQGSGPEIYNIGTGTPDIQYCLVQGGWPGGTAILNTDPALVDSFGADNIPGNMDDNLHLRSDSPCIDEGSNAVTTLPAEDFDGNIRIMDGDKDGTPVVDMGAYEFVDYCECDLNYDGRCDMKDWLLFGQRWGGTDCHNQGVSCRCDLNDDGRCDMKDWLLFGKSWGRIDCPMP